MGPPISNFIETSKFVEYMNETNSIGWYGICNELDNAKYELQNNGIGIYEILKYVFYKLISILSTFLIALIPMLLLLLVTYYAASRIVFPIFNWAWNIIETILCVLSRFGIPKIQLRLPGFLRVWPISKLDGLTIFPGLFPFQFIINVFGDVLKCNQIGSEQFNEKFGTCEQRFAARTPNETNCFGNYATDYTLWSEGRGNDDVLCSNYLDCPNDLKNKMLNENNILVEFFAPIITSGIDKGSAPRKYLECCKVQKNCSDNMEKYASESIENYSTESDEYNIDLSVLFDNNNPFKPLNMYEATKRYFSDEYSWNVTTDESKQNCNWYPRGGLLGRLGLNYIDYIKHYFHKIFYYLKKIIAILIIIFIIIQVFNIFSRIKHGKTIHDIWCKGHPENCNYDYDKSIKMDPSLENQWIDEIRKYLNIEDKFKEQEDYFSHIWRDNKEIINNHDSNFKGIKKEDQNNLFKVMKHYFIPDTDNISGNNIQGNKILDSSLSNSSSGSSLSQIQIIIACFIIITTIITLGIVKVSNIKEKNNKNKKNN